MYLNTFAAGTDPLDMTQTDEFRSLLLNDRRLRIDRRGRLFVEDELEAPLPALPADQQSVLDGTLLPLDQTFLLHSRPGAQRTIYLNFRGATLSGTAWNSGPTINALPFDLEDSLQVVEQARPDIFCFHAGTTRGGLVGFDSGETIEETARRTEEVYARVRAIDPDLILVGHGAAMETPEDAQYLLDHTSGHGFWTGSSTERLPIERAVLAAAQEFARLTFTDGTPRS